MPECSYFPSFSLSKSRTENGQGEKEKWLQPLAGVKEFWGWLLQCIQEQGELPIAPWLLPSAFLWVHSQPHLLKPRYVLNSCHLNKCGYSPSICLYVLSTAVFIPLKHIYSKYLHNNTFVWLRVSMCMSACFCMTPILLLLLPHDCRGYCHLANIFSLTP